MAKKPNYGDLEPLDGQILLIQPSGTQEINIVFDPLGNNDIDKVYVGIDNSTEVFPGHEADHYFNLLSNGNRHARDMGPKNGGVFTLSLPIDRARAYEEAGQTFGDLEGQAFSVYTYSHDSSTGDTMPDANHRIYFFKQ